MKNTKLFDKLLECIQTNDFKRYNALISLGKKLTKAQLNELIEELDK